MSSIEAKAVDASALIRQLSTKAVETVAALMRFSENERIQLDAAKDLLDRNPETSKTQKVDVSGAFAISNADTRALLDALFESKKLADAEPLPPGDSVKLPPAAIAAPSPTT